MGNQYLNSGESIVLTTHSIGVEGGLYDILLTSERIVLVDNRYTRFEPRSIPFTQVISVKGGRIPTGEPVITLVLTETGSLADSRDQYLIFTQQPGEERKHERDLWVKRLIELVISARQHATREETAPQEQGPGVQPTIRRWVAPEHLRPRAGPEKEPAPVKMVVEPDETELPEFLFEESLPDGEVPEGEAGDAVPNDIPAGVPEARDYPDEPDADREIGTAPPAPAPVPFPVLTRNYLGVGGPAGDEWAGTPAAHDENRNPVYTGVADLSDDLLADTGTFPGGAPVTADPERFSRTITAAISSLRPPVVPEEPRQQQEQPVPDDRQEDVDASPADTATDGPVTEPAQDLPPVAGRAAELPEPVPEAPGNPAEEADTGDRIIPAISTPHAITIPADPVVPADEPPASHQPVITPAETPRREELARGAVTPGPEPPRPPHEVPAGKRAVPGAFLAVVALLVLVAGVVIIALLIPPSQVTAGPAPSVTPPVTIPVTTAPVLKNITETGIRVRVISPGPYVGTVGNPGYLHQVSGSGEASYTVLKNDDVVSATISKQDNSGSPLTVEIYADGRLLATRTVTAPMGTIALLIDPKTASPPGISPVTTAPATTSPTGEPTLTDY